MEGLQGPQALETEACIPYCIDGPYPQRLLKIPQTLSVAGDHRVGEVRVALGGAL